MGAEADSAKLVRQTIVAAVVLVVALALAAVAIWMRRPRLEPIEVSQQTTYIITPTRADGWVDYPEAVDWMRRASLDAGGANAATMLVRALGRDVLPIGVDRAALLVRLGIDVADADASAMPALKNVKPMSGRPPREPTPAAMEWLQARCPADAQGPASFAKIMGWLTEVDAPVKDLRTAAQGASLYVPVPRGAAATGNFDRVNPIRLADAAAALACQAAMKLLGGLAADSWNDAEALWRLGALVARAATAGEYAVAEVFWKAALIATVDLAASPATSPELLSTIEAGLGAKLGFPPATETWMFHRLEVLEANGTPLVPAPAKARPAGGPLARVGTAAKLEAINQEFDAIDVALQTPDPAQRIARVEQALPPTAAQVGGTARGVLGVEIQAVSYQRLAFLAVALARRQRDGGKLPGSLAELPSPPKDPGSGRAFIYSVDGARYRLYGVGADGRDDHGAPERDVVVDVREPTPFAAP
jgi:hypothetical protein